MAENKSIISLTFVDVLVLILITLKLTNYIDWSWWWVLSPFWFPLALAGVIAGIIVMIEFLLAVFRRR